MDSRLRGRIALIGASGAGKTSVANRLRDRYGYEICSTGAVCRGVCRILFGNEDKTNLQTLDDALLKIDPSLFLKAALRNVGGAQRTVIDSLRFASDWELARARSYYLVRVVANQELRFARLKDRGQRFDEANAKHSSEVELDEFKFDALIENSGSQEALFAQIERIVAE